MRFVAWLCLVWGMAGCGRILPGPQPSATQGVTATAAPTEKATVTLMPTVTVTPTMAPTATPTATPTFTPTPPVLAAITVENAASVTQVAEMRFGEWQLATALAWSPDGSRLAAAVGEAVYLYAGPPLAFGEWQQLAQLPIGALTPGLAFDAAGQRLAAGSRDGMLRLWSVAALLAGSVEPAWQVQAHKKGVNSVQFSPSGERLASGGNDAVARAWDSATGELLETTVGGTYAVPAVAFAPDGQALAVVNGPLIRLRKVGTRQIVGSFRAANQLFSAAFSPDGQLLAAGDNDNHVLLWAVAQAYRTGQETYAEPVILDGHAGWRGNFRALIWQVAFSPDGSILASAGGDGAVWLWDVEKKAPLGMLAGHTAGVSGAAFSPDGRLLASSGLDYTVRIWGVWK